MSKQVNSIKTITSFKNTSVIEQPVKALLLLIPFVLMFCIGAITMGMTDTLYVLRWAAVLFAGTLITLPIAAKLFGGFGSGGFSGGGFSGGGFPGGGDFPGGDFAGGGGYNPGIWIWTVACAAALLALILIIRKAGSHNN